MTSSTNEPIELTPSQRVFMEIDSKIRSDLVGRVDQLIEESRSVFVRALADAKLADQNLSTPPTDLFRGVALQHLFCRMCDAESLMSEGNPEQARPIINNLQNRTDSWTG
jgi:hypothetical protein